MGLETTTPTDTRSECQSSDADGYDAGTLLLELERRQDEVLVQLDELDKKLSALLVSLGVSLTDESTDSAFSQLDSDEQYDEEQQAADPDPPSPSELHDDETSYESDRRRAA